MHAVDVVWWNVQRCFSPRATRISAELEATPSDGWTEEVYARKLDNLAAVLRRIFAGNAPGIVALCEIENSQVLRDLLERLQPIELRVAEGDDGQLEAYDIVVLYAPAFFEQDGLARSYNIHNRFRTRDLFEVAFRTRDGEPFSLLANHWPSRLIRDADALRIGLADYARRIVEGWVKLSWNELSGAEGGALPERALIERRWNRPGIVLGDFNDDPFDSSVARVLNARRRRASVVEPLQLPADGGLSAIKRYLSMSPRLYNPTWAALASQTRPAGTFLWNGDWYCLDQMLFTRGMLGESSVRYVEGSLHVFAEPEVPGTGGRTVKVLTRGGTPRAFAPDCADAASDHLPLVCTIEVP